MVQALRTIDTLLGALEVIPADWALVAVGSSKAPMYRDWETTPLTVADFRDAVEAGVFEKAGGQPVDRIAAVGVLCGRLSNGLLFLDHDGASCDALIEKLSGVSLKEALPRTVAVTSGRPGRYQCVYRIPEMFWDGIQTRKVKTGAADEDGKPEQLEFRWDGCQSVVIGKHPKTGSYRWFYSPADVPVAEAPAWMIEQMLRQSEPEASRQPSLPLDTMSDEEWARSYLEAIPPADDYDTWLHVGMALHSVSDRLLDDWDGWSKGASNYQPNACTNKWKTFKKSGTGVGTLGHIAKQHGWKSPSKQHLSLVSSNALTPVQHATAETVDPSSIESQCSKLRDAVEAYVNESDPFRQVLLENALSSEYRVSGRKLEKLVRAVRGSGGNLARINDLAIEVFGEIEHRCQYGAPVGMLTGFDEFDRLTSGLQRGELLITAGRPAMGKTSFAVNCAVGLARNGHRVIMFSHEMSNKLLTYRMLSALSNVELWKIKSGRVSAAEWEAVSLATTTLADLPITMREFGSKTVEQMADDCHEFGPFDAVMVDYLQLMEGKGENRNQEISSITRGLKTLAGELSCSVNCLSQLSRDVESRNNKRPMMSDLRDSGAIEQDADLIVMLYRDEYYNPETVDRGLGEVNIVKHRNGPTGTIKLLFERDYSRFRNV